MAEALSSAPTMELAVPPHEQYGLPVPEQLAQQTQENQYLTFLEGSFNQQNQQSFATEQPAASEQRPKGPMNYQEQLEFFVDKKIPSPLGTEVPHVYDLIVAGTRTKDLNVNIGANGESTYTYKTADGPVVDKSVAERVLYKTDLENWKLSQNDINAVGRILKAKHADQLDERDVYNFAEFTRKLPKNPDSENPLQDAFNRFKSYAAQRFELSQLIVDYETGSIPEFQFENGAAAGGVAEDMLYAESVREEQIRREEASDDSSNSLGSQEAGLNTYNGPRSTKSERIKVSSERMDQPASGNRNLSAGESERASNNGAPRELESPKDSTVIEGEVVGEVVDEILGPIVETRESGNEDDKKHRAARLSGKVILAIESGRSSIDGKQEAGNEPKADLRQLGKDQKRTNAAIKQRIEENMPDLQKIVDFDSAGRPLTPTNPRRQMPLQQIDKIIDHKDQIIDNMPQPGSETNKS